MSSKYIIGAGVASTVLGFTAGHMISDMNIRFQQNLIDTVLRMNNREGIYITELHVGRGGTTLKFGTISRQNSIVKSSSD